MASLKTLVAVWLSVSFLFVTVLGQGVPTATISCKPTGGTWKASNGKTVVQYICTTTVQNNNNNAVMIQFNCGNINPAAVCDSTHFDCIYPGQVTSTCATPQPVWNQGPFVFTLQTTMGFPWISIISVKPKVDSSNPGVPTATVNCKTTGGTWLASNGKTVVQYMCTTTVQNNNNRGVCIQFMCGNINPAAQCTNTNFDCIYPGQMTSTCSTPLPVWNQGPYVITLQTTKGNPLISVLSVTPKDKCL